MNIFPRNLKWYVLGLLLVATFFIWQAVLTEDRHFLTVAFLDIGQGDAIYIEAPNGNQVIVDGGPDASLLRRLGTFVPAYDRTIDAIVVTNPDKDHFAGFVDLLDRYDVGTLIEPGTRSGTAVYRALEEKARERGVKKIIAREGMKIDLGGGAAIEVLFPDRDVANWKTNDGSIVAKVVYGDTSVLLMGDSTKLTESIVEGEEGKRLKSDILKIGHHGSRTSTGEALLQLAAPAYAVISAGRDNTYGHPHPETLAVLEKFGVETHVTAEEGTVIYQSDGRKFVRR